MLFQHKYEWIIFVANLFLFFLVLNNGKRRLYIDKEKIRYKELFYDHTILTKDIISCSVNVTIRSKLRIRKIKIHFYNKNHKTMLIAHQIDDYTRLKKALKKSNIQVNLHQ